ncbi:MAG: alpha/beta fold hydrolase [Algiphilus sp.]
MNAAADSALPVSTAYTQLPSWEWRDSQRFLSVRGRQRAAQPGCPTLHWLSGNGFCGGVYWPMLARLDARFGLITHDLAGHGESDRVRQFDGVARNVHRIRSALTERKPTAPLVAMGHSFGAALSLRMVAQMPEAFSALILLDPIILPRRYWLGSKLAAALRRNPMAQAARRRREAWPDAVGARDALEGRGIYKGWTDEALDAFIGHATFEEGDRRRLCCDPELEAQIFENPLYLWRDIPRLQVPTLLLYGEGSYFFMAPSAQRCAAMQPRLRAEGLPGGHCFMQEDPDTTAARINDWLSEIGLSPGR